MWRRIKNYAQTLRKGADSAIHSEERLKQLLHMQILQVQTQIFQSLSETPRFQDPLRLLSNGYKVYSQNQEDGMIAEVFRRIGTTSRRFIEFGVEDGLECNSTFLLVQGWRGAWIEGSQHSATRAQSIFKDYPVKILNQYITVDNADELIASLSGGEELDLLSIDVDSVDYWIWKAIKTVKPRLLVIEYNATLPPTLRKTIPNDPALIWDGSNYFGASLGALEALGRAKSYSLVGCSVAGVNAFFVRDDLVADQFCAPFTAINHYEPPRYELSGPCGHRPGIGRWVDV